MNENVTLSLIFLIVAGLVSWLLWLISRHVLRTRSLRAQTLLQDKLIEKLSSSGALIEAAQGDLSAVLKSLVPNGSGGPSEQILESTRTGVVALCVGAACLVLRWSAQSAIGRELFLTIALVLLGLGVGFSLSAFISYRLYRALGVLASGKQSQ